MSKSSNEKLKVLFVAKINNIPFSSENKVNFHNYTLILQNHYLVLNQGITNN